ncbi:UNVERIFIED_CONTAM: hypothetical protein NCL1_52626 [Trichonephila clavipes]
MDDALINAKSLSEELEISFEPPRQIWRKHIFGDEMIFSMDELNLDQASQDINKEFQLKGVRLQAFVAATDPGCKKELIRSGSLGLLKYVIESKLENVLPNIVISLRIFNICHQ